MTVTRRDLLRFGIHGGGMLALGMGGCTQESSRGRSEAKAGVPHVVATVAMAGDLVSRVGGEDVRVTTMMGSGVDPHLYKPIRDDFRLLQTADIIFSVGLMLEGRLQEFTGRSGAGRRVVALGEQLPEERLFWGEADEGEAASGHPDPHVWMDVELWSSVLPVIAELLGEKLPGLRATFQHRAELLVGELLGLHQYGRTVIGSIPAASRVLVTSHDAFRYFGRAYGLDVLGVQGLSTESEAGLLRVNELVDLLVTRRVSAVFVESSVPRKSMEALIEGAASRGHVVQVGGSLYSDAMGTSGTWEGTYAGMLDHNLTVVSRSLGGTAPVGGYRGRLAVASREGF